MYLPLQTLRGQSLACNQSVKRHLPLLARTRAASASLVLPKVTFLAWKELLYQKPRNVLQGFISTG